MDLLFWLIFLFIIIFFGSRVIPVKGVNSITTSDLKNIVKQKDKQLIDVRTSGEFQANNIKQFTNIPLQQLQKSVDTLDKSKETILICQSGMRSMRAARILKKAGFTNLTNVKTGMNGWY